MKARRKLARCLRAVEARVQRTRYLQAEFSTERMSGWRSVLAAALRSAPELPPFAWARALASVGGPGGVWPLTPACIEALAAMATMNFARGPRLRRARRRAARIDAQIEASASARSVTARAA